MKPSRRRSGESSSARSGGTIVTWLHMQKKFGDALRLRALQGQRRRGSGRLEADREEDDVAVGVLLRDPQRVERRVDHPDVGALGLGVGERLLGPGHPHHVAEAGEDHVVLGRHRDPVVDPAHRHHADRTARSVNQLDVLRAAGRRDRTCRWSGCGRRRPPSPCSGGRARPLRGSAARAPARARRRGTRRRTSSSRRALLTLLMVGNRGTGMDEQPVALDNRLHKRDLHGAPACLVPGAQSASSRARSILRTLITSASSPQVMHPVA